MKEYIERELESQTMMQELLQKEVLSLIRKFSDFEKNETKSRRRMERKEKERKDYEQVRQSVRIEEEERERMRDMMREKRRKLE